MLDVLRDKRDSAKAALAYRYRQTGPSQERGGGVGWGGQGEMGMTWALVIS